MSFQSLINQLSQSFIPSIDYADVARTIREYDLKIPGTRKCDDCDTDMVQTMHGDYVSMQCGCKFRMRRFVMEPKDVTDAWAALNSHRSTHAEHYDRIVGFMSLAGHGTFSTGGPEVTEYLVANFGPTSERYWNHVNDIISFRDEEDAVQFTLRFPERRCFTL